MLGDATTRVPALKLRAPVMLRVSFQYPVLVTRDMIVCVAPAASGMIQAAMLTWLVIVFTDAEPGALAAK
jgi:hypothetical protein